MMNEQVFHDGTIQYHLNATGIPIYKPTNHETYVVGVDYGGVWWSTMVADPWWQQLNYYVL